MKKKCCSISFISFSSVLSIASQQVLHKVLPQFGYFFIFPRAFPRTLCILETWGLWNPLRSSHFIISILFIMPMFMLHWKILREVVFIPINIDLFLGLHERLIFPTIRNTTPLPFCFSKDIIVPFAERTIKEKLVFVFFPSLPNQL